ncbi:MAG: signal peptidase I, partial [Lachnospiraceae bacterium]|nr:signal peptidase I [Candidatus Equihabitans merdae]
MKVVKKKVDEDSLRAVKRMRSMVLWIIEILVAILLALLFAIAFCYQMTAQDVSMSPTIESGDKILVNRAAYKIGQPDRGDLIVYTEGEGKSATIHIKRVIGLPGETIQIHDGQIVINDKTYTTDTEYPLMTNPGLAKEK